MALRSLIKPSINFTIFHRLPRTTLKETMESRASSPRSTGTSPDTTKSSSHRLNNKEGGKWQTSKEIIFISVYFYILLALFLGYKIWLFITNYRLLDATHEDHDINPFKAALLEAIPGLVPVTLYILLVPSMLGARLYDYLTNQHRGPRRRLFIMTLVL